MAPVTAEYALCASLLLLLGIWFYPRKTLRLPPRPPAPKTRSKPWLHWTEMAETYGDILAFQSGRKTIIVLNSPDVVHELLEKRSAIYSSRPAMTLSKVARGGGGTLASVEYGDHWRKIRKLAHGALMASSADKYKPWQTLESYVLLKRLLENPAEWQKHVAGFSASVVTQISYGVRVTGMDEPVIVENDKINKGGLRRLAGNSIVEDYPLLRFAPSWMIPALAEARRACKNDLQYYNGLFEEVRERVHRGSPVWSFARDLQEKTPAEHGLSLESLWILAAVPLAAGIDTTTLILRGFLFACAAAGPSFLPRAQAEIAAIVGESRMPMHEDVAAMPFVTAIAKEVHRWCRVAPFGVPHAVTENDTYNGYDIPKGATVIYNNWKIHSDPAYFPDPQAFKPERFVEEKRLFPGAHGHYGFGMGRRVCPGQHVAENAYNLAIARLIWAFNIRATASVDLSESNRRDGGVTKYVIYSLFIAWFERWNSDYINIPVAFHVRSPAHAKLISEEYSAAEAELRHCETR